MPDQSEAPIVRKAREAWNRVLNMDGGQAQAIAAGLWASIYADALLAAVAQIKGQNP